MVIPTVKTKNGEAAFNCYTAQLWNQLPDDIKGAPTVARFKSRLKKVIGCFLLTDGMHSTFFYVHLAYITHSSFLIFDFSVLF